MLVFLFTLQIFACQLSTHLKNRPSNSGGPHLSYLVLFFPRRVFGVFYLYIFKPTGLKMVDVCFVEQNRIFNELLIFFFGTFLIPWPFFTENGKQLPCSECLLTDVPSSILILGFVSPKTKRTIRRINERKNSNSTCHVSCYKAK